MRQQSAGRIQAWISRVPKLDNVAAHALRVQLLATLLAPVFREVAGRTEALGGYGAELFARAVAEHLEARR